MEKERNMWLINRLSVPVLLLVFILTYYFEVRDIPSSELILIQPVTIIMIILTFTVIFIEVKNWRKIDFSSESPVGEENPDVHAKLTRKLAIYITSIALYLIMLNYIGFIISSLIFVPSLLYLLGTKSMKLNIAIGFGVTVFVYLLFDVWLGINLPEGILG